MPKTLGLAQLKRSSVIASSTASTAASTPLTRSRATTSRPRRKRRCNSEWFLEQSLPEFRPPLSKQVRSSTTPTAAATRPLHVSTKSSTAAAALSLHVRQSSTEAPTQPLHVSLMSTLTIASSLSHQIAKSTATRGYQFSSTAAKRFVITFTKLSTEASSGCSLIGAQLILHRSLPVRIGKRRKRIKCTSH